MSGTDGQPRGLASRILGQSGLLFSGFALAQALSFGRNAVLGHWLSKGDFGIAATITLTLQMIEILSDLGAERLIVQAADGEDRRLIANLHATLVLRGLLTAAVLLLAAGPAARFFHVAQAWPAFAAMALVPLVKGFLNLDTRRRQRHFDNRAYIVVEVAPQLAAAVAMVPVLVLEPSYHAVVWLALVQAIGMVAVSHMLAERRFEMGFDRALLARIVAFGWPIWLSAFPLVAVYQGDRALVGRMLGIDMLAGYSAAFMLTMVPGLLAAKVGNAILLPLLAQARDSTIEFARRFRLMVEITVLAAALYAAAFIVCGEALLPLAFGPSYRGLGGVSAWLAVTWAVRMVQAVPGMALLAHATTRPFFGAGLVRAAGLLGAFGAISAGAGIEGVAAAGLAAELGSLLYMCRQLDRVAGGLGTVCLGRASVLVPAIGAAVALSGVATGLAGGARVFAALVCVIVPVAVLVLPELRRACEAAWRDRLMKVAAPAA